MGEPDVMPHLSGTGELVVSAPGMADLHLSLSAPSPHPGGVAESAASADNMQPGSRQVQVLGDRVSAGLAAAVGDDGSGGAAAWFTAAVGAPCTLVRQLQGARSPVLGRSDRNRPRAPSAPPQSSAVVDTASVASGRQAGSAEAQTEQAGLSAGPASGEPGLTSMSSSRGGGDSIGDHHELSSGWPLSASKYILA